VRNREADVYLLHEFYLSATSAEEPPNTLFPSGKATRRALAVDLVPSLGKYPSTVTWSACFRESFLQPCLSSTGIAPSSKFQLVTLPLASFTST
jgi:hypothetical protein